MNRKLLLAVTGFVLAGVPLVAQQMTVKLYTVADGLGHNLLHRIYSDHEGILWFCTSDGVTRFDGQHFLNFNSAHGAPFSDTFDIVETRGGDYWIATRGEGIVRLKDTAPLDPMVGGLKTRFEPHRVADTAESNDVQALYEDKSGEVWIGSLGGLYRLREKRGAPEIQQVPIALPGLPDRNLRVYGFAEDPEGGLYASTQAGVVRILPDGGHVFYAYPAGYQADDLGSLAFQDGVLWLGQGGGLFLLRPATASRSGPGPWTSDALIRASEVDYPRPFTMPATPDKAIAIRLDRDAGNNHVFAVRKLDDGRIWLASFGGLFEFSGGQLHRILPGAPFDYILKLGQDAAGNMWLGTNGFGAARVSFMSYRSFSRSDGLGKSISMILIDHDGHVLIPCWPRELAILSGERFKKAELKLAKNVSYSGIQTLLQDRGGEWWVATTDGLYHFPQTHRPEELPGVAPLEVFRQAQGLPDEEFSRIFEDHRGDVWLGFDAASRTAISRWDRRTGRLHAYSIEDGLPPRAGFLRDIAEDGEKSLWFAFSDGGLVRWKDGRFQTFGDSPGATGKHVAGMATDDHGRVWLAIAGRGLARIDGEKDGRLLCKTYALSEGITEERYTGTPVLSDAKGRIYVGLMHGLDRLDPSTGAMAHYSAVDGIPLGPIWSLARDPAGGIWVTNKTQAVRIQPDEIPETAPAPVLISGLRVSGVDYRVPVKGARSFQHLELSYEKNSLQIEFMGLAFGAHRSPLFQYRLEGAASDWSEPTSVGTVNYASLAPGDYRFEAREVPRGGDAGVAPAELSFRILRPFWRRSWFIGSLALVLLSALVGFERYRSAKLSQVRSALAQLSSANEALDIEAAMSRVLAQSGEESALPSVLETLCRRTGWESGAFWERDRESAVLRRAAQWPDNGEAAAVLPPGRGLIGAAIDSGELQWRNSPAGGCAFPIRVGDVTLGAIELCSSGPRMRDAGAATLATIGGMLGQWIERLRAERALRVSEARFRTLAATAPDAIVTIDERGAIVFTNPSVSAVFGYPAERMAGQELTMLMPERLRQAHREGFGRYLKTGQRQMAWNAIELPGLHADGREMSLELSFGEFRRDRERFFTAMIRDVTERKRTEEALRRSREERLAEIERIRRRIATDLHDDIGSSLTQIAVLSEVARQQVEGEVQLERPLEIIAGSSRELIDSMSDIVWAINPQRDHLRDLVHRMRRFAADTLTARSIEFTLRLPDSEADVKLEGNLRREVFLIFKEALNNAVRHSGCTRAEIELQVPDDRLLLRVADNGKGMDLATTSDGHGLASMRGRAEGLGGKLEIVSSRGQGSVISLEAPFHASLPPKST